MSAPGLRTATDGDRVSELLRAFTLTTAAEELVPRLVTAGLADAIPVIAEVLETEAEVRHQRRVDRLRRASKLPPAKTFETFNAARLTAALRQKLDKLKDGAFLADATNVLAFGLPGTGKSHALAALGHKLVQAGHSVLFAATYELVQELLAAKRDLELPRKLRKLDHFELVILDDIGYVSQSADEAEVLFTLLAERYERRSTAITSNLVFSEWERIFKNKMATTAAIDRLVHHSVILEFDVASYRGEQAEEKLSRSPSTKRRNR
jgi:DNA replication protein DnaC